MSELVGWRAIAEHLGVSVRTAQRYESLALPVQRGKHADEVHTTRAELDRWLSETTSARVAGEAGAIPSATEVTDSRDDDAAHVVADQRRPQVSVMPPRPAWNATRRDSVWAAAVLVAAVGGLLVGRTHQAPLPQARPVARDESPDSLIVGDRRGQLVGRIAIDMNQNGEWDAGEEFVAEPGRACPHTRTVAGVIVRWEGVTLGSSAATNCNPEPFYHANLAPGRYRVMLSLPHGWRATSATMADVEVQTSRDTHLWFAITPSP